MRMVSTRVASFVSNEGSRFESPNNNPAMAASQMNVSGSLRRGLSIMEILFAIAVLTIGLLGVASILPVATNNASMALQTTKQPPPSN